MNSSALLFWIALLLLGYTYLGYPALLWAWDALRPRPIRPQGIAPAEPPVSVLVVGHNEAERIEERLRNLLSLDYPQARLEIVLASDGSTDDTVERARAYEPAGVKVFAFESRRGKPAVLNALIPKMQGEIIVLADARQRFEPKTLRVLAGAFADPQVGAVSGELMLTPAAKDGMIGEGVGAYWRYEKFIRRHESRVDSTVGATGAIYAIRRDLFEPTPEDTILDDVLIPIRIARRGYRVLFEPGARAWDRAAATPREEFTRKVRTIAGNFQLFARESWLLNPFHNRLWLQTISHKGLRLLSPVLLMTAFWANCLLTANPLYRAALGGQVLFYAAALGGYVLRHAHRSLPILSVPYMFCLLHWATVVALFRFVTGGQSVMWERVSR